MTEKELLQRAEAYAKEIYADCDLSDIGVQDEINALALNCMCFAKVLMEDYCLVEKSKVKEMYGEFKSNVFRSYGEPATVLVKASAIDVAKVNLLEYLFGNELFPNTEQ